MWASWAQSVCSRFEERTQEETLHQERCARRAAWDLAKKFTRSKIRTRQRSSLLLNPRRRRRLLQNYWRNESSWLILELQCTCWAKKDLSSAETDTLRRSRTTTVVTASGEVQTNEEAQVYVHDLDLFVTVQLLDDTLAVLSLGKLCEENGYSYERSKRFKTTADQKWEGNFLQNGKFRTSFCSWIVVKFWYQIFFYIATAGFIKCFFESRTTAKWRASTRRPARFKKKHNKNKKESNNQATGDRLRDLPGWLQEFTDNIEDTETPVLADVPQDSESERSAKVVSKFLETQYLYSLPKRPKLRSMLANQDDKGSLQKTHWWCSTSSNWVRWLDNSRSHSPQRGRWISE